jgi:UDP-glucose 4-epimerase
MRIFVTGAAGFIGSNLCDRLLADGHDVCGWDNFSTGQSGFLDEALKNPRFRLLRGDNLDFCDLAAGMAGCEMVCHFAANADVRRGFEWPERDLQQNTMATFNVLEAMRKNAIRRIAFSSTGCVYGEAPVIPTPEDAPFPIQTSLYGASKAACEGLISAYCEGYGFHGTIYRFVSILGERYMHGHVIDFYRQVKEHPGFLTVLGDGSQRKSYLHVRDCVAGILYSTDFGDSLPTNGKFRIFNLGVDDFCSVRQSAQWICEEMGLTPEIRFTGGDRGWIGDNPFTYLDTGRICGLGWRPDFSIRDAIRSTVRWLAANPWAVKAAR